MIKAAHAGAAVTHDQRLQGSEKRDDSCSRLRAGQWNRSQVLAMVLDCLQRTWRVSAEPRPQIEQSWDGLGEDGSYCSMRSDMILVAAHRHCFQGGLADNVFFPRTTNLPWANIYTI